jgi:hypothetical protein
MTGDVLIADIRDKSVNLLVAHLLGAGPPLALAETQVGFGTFQGANSLTDQLLGGGCNRV